MYSKFKTEFVFIILILNNFTVVKKIRTTNYTSLHSISDSTFLNKIKSHIRFAVSVIENEANWQFDDGNMVDVDICYYLLLLPASLPVLLIWFFFVWFGWQIFINN